MANFDVHNDPVHGNRTGVNPAHPRSRTVADARSDGQPAAGSARSQASMPGHAPHASAPAAEGADQPRRVTVFTAVRWGAVLAGVAVGLSIQMVLTLLGIATGLTTTDIAQGDTVGMGPLLWAGASMLISAFVGGYVAARMSGLKRKADGVLHGAVSWAVTTILFAVLATSIGGALVGGVFNNMTQMAQAQSQAAQGQGPLAALGEGQMDAATLNRLEQYLENGQRSEAVQLLRSATGMARQRAAAVIDQALILSGSPEAASPQARQAASRAVQGAGAAAWVVFGAVALALLLGMGGGTLGAAGARRVRWTDSPAAPS